jgi:hypothetical protein
MADRFYISPPSGNAAGVTGEILPFIVQAAGTTLQDGTVVPAGVYIDSAYIRNGTITNAKIGDATIDNAKIANLSASKITAGTLQVGTTLQSSNYNGVSGWYIRSSDGYAEFNNIKARGEIAADNGTIGGLVIASDRIYSVGKGYDASGTGFHLQSNGELRVGNYYGAFMEFVSGRFIAKSGAGTGPDVSWLDLGATGGSSVLKIKDKLYINADGTAYFNGTLNATGGSFSGTLNAAGGSFTGTLSAATAQVDTLNIAGNAVTVPVGSTAYGVIPSHTVSMNTGGAIFVSITANFLATAAGPNTTVFLNIHINGGTQNTVAISIPGGFSSSATATCKVDVGPGVHSIAGSWSYSGTIMTLGTSSTFAIGVQR